MIRLAQCRWQCLSVIAANIIRVAKYVIAAIVLRTDQALYW